MFRIKSYVLLEVDREHEGIHLRLGSPPKDVLLPHVPFSAHLRSSQSYGTLCTSCVNALLLRVLAQILCHVLNLKINNRKEQNEWLDN